MTAAAALVTKADLKAELARLEGRLIAAGFRLVFAVVALVIATNTGIVFGLLKLLLSN